MSTGPIDQVPLARRRLLLLIKLKGTATIADLAEATEMSGEAVRQQLLPSERDLWIERAEVPPSGEAGRPPARYRLTIRGEALFPKAHATLALGLIDSIRSELGDEALMRVLGHITDARVAAMLPIAQPPAAPDDLDTMVAGLRAIYAEDDPFLTIEKIEGGYRIVERNCPFLGVALERPLLCSSTVTVLARVLGRHVVREERFQDGHGRCVFRVYADRPIPRASLRFAVEPPPPIAGGI